MRLCDYIIRANVAEVLQTRIMQVPTVVSRLDTILILWGHLVILQSQKDMETRHRLRYSSLFMRQVCFPICMVVRSVELVSTSRTSSCRSSSVSASRARFFSCSSICKYRPSCTQYFFLFFWKELNSSPLTGNNWAVKLKIKSPQRLKPMENERVVLFCGRSGTFVR